MTTTQNEAMKEILKVTSVFIKEKGGQNLTFSKVENFLVDRFGKSSFESVKPFVEGIMYTTGVRPGSRKGMQKRSPAPKSRLATTSSVAHVVDAIVSGTNEKDHSTQLEQVWTKLAVSKSTRDLERRQSTFAGYSMDAYLLPSPALFCVNCKSEQERELKSLTVLLESFDVIAREHRTNPSTSFGAEEELSECVHASDIIVAKIETRLLDLTKKIGGEGGARLWAAPTRGDENLCASPFLGAIIANRYILKKYIATGSYKTCWKAQDLITDKPVCLATPKGMFFIFLLLFFFFKKSTRAADEDTTSNA